MAKTSLSVGDRISVGGEVKYGNSWYNVSSEGTIEEIHPRTMLVTLDYIDGDHDACVIVNKKIVHSLEEN